MFPGFRCPEQQCCLGNCLTHHPLAAQTLAVVAACISRQHLSYSFRRGNTVHGVILIVIVRCYQAQQVSCSQEMQDNLPDFGNRVAFNQNIDLDIDFPSTGTSQTSTSLLICLPSEICTLGIPWLQEEIQPRNATAVFLRVETVLRPSLPLAVVLHVGRDTRHPAALHCLGSSVVACLASLANPVLLIPSIANCLVM